MARYFKTLAAIGAVVIVGLYVGAVAHAAQGEKAKAPTVFTSFWSLPKQGDTVVLVVAGSAEPVTFNTSADTGFGGVCIHCMLNQPFKFKEFKFTCGVCGCTKTNAECIAWKDLKKNTMDEVMNVFPVGLAMKATFNTPGDPKSGLKSLWVDRRTVLLSVEGLDGKTPADLATIAKAVGGGKAEAIDGGKKLIITLKADYDGDLPVKLVKAIEKAGVKILRPTEVADAK